MIPATDGLTRRRLRRDELDRIWEIDRRETVERTYRVAADELVLRDDFFDIRGWPPHEAEQYEPILADAFDRGAVFSGVFDGSRLVAVGVTDALPRGRAGDLRQLSFLHVAHGYRDRGLGAELFEEAMEFAAARGAAGLYVSATPSEHTIAFYLGRGCRVTDRPDPDLLALEPDDIHLECRRRSGLARMILFAAVGALIITLASFGLFDYLNRDCVDLGCMDILLFFPVAVVGAGILALGMGSRAGDGCRGYAAVAAGSGVGLLVAMALIQNVLFYM